MGSTLSLGAVEEGLPSSRSWEPAVPVLGMTFSPSHLPLF
jgi:hypothetical protein